MASSRRKIDKVPVVPRKTEMKVLALGLARTGTNSLMLALNELGYNSYHMWEVMRLSHGPYWTEAMQANLEPRTVKPPYGVVEFDKLLHDYDAVTDMPMALFVEDFLTAYPDAKVILTTRGFDGWHASLHRTLFRLFSSKAWDILYYFGRGGFPDARRAGRLAFEKLVPDGDYMDKEQLRAGAEAHHKLVRSVVPKERLLEFRSQDGWEPLCKFLGKDIPSTPYPNTNDAASIEAFLDKAFIFTSLEAVFKVLVGAGGFGVLVAWGWKYLPKDLQY